MSDVSVSLADLIAHVERAEGPSRELDADIAVLATGRRWPSADFHPSYTASLDAALALVEAVLPGALYEIKAFPARLGHGASLWSDDPAVDRMLARADHRTPALALVLALLKACNQKSC